jgi:hypothetical protein
VEPQGRPLCGSASRTLWLSLSLSANLVASAWAGAPQLGGPLPTPLPLFPPDNWWNLDISTAPVDPGSAAYISFIGGDRLHPDFGGTYGPGGVNVYGLPYVVVDASQPKRTVTFTYADESDGVGYPIPDEAITEPHWIEHGEPGNALVSGVDRHVLIVDKDNGFLYELYNAFWNGAKWTAASGAFFDMKTNDRRPEGWTSADAAGLAILPGLVRYDEVYGPDEIQHAFRFTVRATNGYVYPASHRAGSTPGARPMGARLRLKAGKDVSGFPAEMQRIFRAKKKYGLIVAANGSDMYLSRTFDRFLRPPALPAPRHAAPGRARRGAGRTRRRPARGRGRGPLRRPRRREGRLLERGRVGARGAGQPELLPGPLDRQLRPGPDLCEQRRRRPLLLRFWYLRSLELLQGERPRRDRRQRLLRVSRRAGQAKSPGLPGGR